jgi:hypothetical protein
VTGQAVGASPIIASVPSFVSAGSNKEVPYDTYLNTPVWQSVIKPVPDVSLSFSAGPTGNTLFVGQLSIRCQYPGYYYLSLVVDGAEVQQSRFDGRDPNSSAAPFQLLAITHSMHLPPKSAGHRLELFGYLIQTLGAQLNGSPGEVSTRNIAAWSF